MSFINGKSFRSALLLVLIVGLFILPLIFSNPARIGMFISCGTASVLAMGWLLILRVGCLSLGQVAFLAIGGYASAVLWQKFGINPWLGLLAGGIASGLVAFVVGVIFLRIRGFSLAIVTFAFAEIVRLVFSNLEVFGGHGGIMGIAPLPALSVPGFGTVSFDSPLSSYYVMLMILLVSAAFMWRMDRSALGRTFKSLPQNEDMAESLGIRPLKYKLIGFVTACFFAGVTGAFTAHYYGILSPASFTVLQSIFVQIQGTVGGVYSVVWGGLLGASVMVGFETWLLKIDARWVLIFYGSIIIAVTFLLPDGLLSLPEKVKRFFSRT